MDTWSIRKTKPIQSQLKPIQSQSKPIQSQFKPIKANSKPKKCCIHIEPAFFRCFPVPFNCTMFLIFDIVMVKTHGNTIDHFMFIPCVNTSDALIKIRLEPHSPRTKSVVAHLSTLLFLSCLRERVRIPAAHPAAPPQCCRTMLERGALERRLLRRRQGCSCP